MAQRTTTAPSRAQDTNVAYPPSPFRMFEDFFNDWAFRTARTGQEGWRPPVDILEKDGNLILRVEIPGVDEKSISLKIEGQLLTVKGERKSEESDGFTYHQVESTYGTFSRSFTLPDSVDTNHIEANYKNGILVITMPQKQEVKPRSIKVSV